MLDEPRRDVARRLGGSDADREEVCEELSRLHRLSEVLIRNRKKVVGEFMPRQATRWPVTLSPDEYKALEWVEAYVQYGFSLADETAKNAIGFAMTTYQKIMASSINALLGALKRRQQRIIADNESTTTWSTPDQAVTSCYTDSDGDDSSSVFEAGEHSELEWLDTLIPMVESLPRDSKGDEFVKQMGILFEAEPRAKVLVFTQYIDTQDYLADRLGALTVNGRLVGIHLFRGALSTAAKDAAINSFRTGTGPHVLISTESGGEGRNFQFCHHLVNYDLPWNPMRVEQRIGRLDRIGQDHVVNIFSLYSERTIEERVLNVLENRINAFVETVGGLDPILGEVESDLRKILRRAPELQDDAIAEFSERLESQVRDARRADEQLRDFIMDTRSYRKEIVELISNHRELSADERSRFFKELLIDVNTWIDGPEESGEFMLHFHEPFRSDHDDILDHPRLRAVFDPGLRRDLESVAFLAFGHPIIEAIRKKVLDSGHEGTVGAWAMPEDRDLPYSQGWLFVYVLDTTGLEPRSDLLPVYVADDGDVSTAIGYALVNRAGFYRSEEDDLGRATIPYVRLEAAQRDAETLVSDEADARKQTASALATERLAREQQRLTAWFDQRERNAADKLADVATTLNRLRASSDPGDQRILPVWEARHRDAERLVHELPREREQRLASLERGRMPDIEWKLVAAARIEIRSRE